VKRLFIPIGLLIVLGIFYGKILSIIKLHVGVDFHNLIGHAFFVAVTLFIASSLHMMIRMGFRLYSRRFTSSTKTTLDEEFLPLFRRLFAIVLWTITLIIILNHFGVNISALVAALGVASLAIALAAQDTISNIIAGFLIMIDRPFRVGDRIKLPTGEMVEALAIGIRRSQFKAEDGAIVIVPNLDLSKSKIINYTYGEEGKT